MTFLRTYWREVATVVVLLVAAVALYAFLYNFDPFGRRAAETARAETAEQQADLNQGATQTVEHVLRTETIVRTQAEEAADAIVSSEGADAPLSDELLSSWRAGIDGVRQSTQASPDPRS